MDETYMSRCLQLAKLGAGHVAPNPMVGAVLVHSDRIIGEGYHQQYGGAHAEPNCIASVEEQDRHLVSRSTLYVSLEPCVHFGKTPPCADLIIKNKIPKVVIGCRDPFSEVKGRGIEKLITGGVKVEEGVLENECRELNKRFMVFHEHHRPFIILKWAETANHFIATSPQTPLQPRAQEHCGGARRGAFEQPGNSRLFITNDFTNRLVHKWRSEEAAILVGTNTAFMDDPQLTTRLWKGNNPIRLVVDMDLSLPSSLKLFNEAANTIVFNSIKHDLKELTLSPFPMERVGVRWYQVTRDVSLVHQITNALHQLKIQSMIVEGGASLLQTFIDEGMWDEARIIKNEELIINNGLAAPVLENCQKVYEEKILTDHIDFFKRIDS
jgi:diaminohydroxyphosphoribosylaminopyrimidine deaminase/5-amino-6-(5-phosphoribosylamino)uracil reductase